MSPEQAHTKDPRVLRGGGPSSKKGSLDHVEHGGPPSTMSMSPSAARSLSAIKVAGTERSQRESTSGSTEQKKRARQKSETGLLGQLGCPRLHAACPPRTGNMAQHDKGPDCQTPQRTDLVTELLQGHLGSRCAGCMAHSCPKIVGSISAPCQRLWLWLELLILHMTSEGRTSAI